MEALESYFRDVIGAAVAKACIAAIEMGLIREGEYSFNQIVDELIPVDALPYFATQLMHMRHEAKDELMPEAFMLADISYLRLATLTFNAYAFRKFGRSSFS